jgi:hypothetical protein
MLYYKSPSSNTIDHLKQALQICPFLSIYTATFYRNIKLLYNFNFKVNDYLQEISLHPRFRSFIKEHLEAYCLFFRCVHKEYNKLRKVNKSPSFRPREYSEILKPFVFLSATAQDYISHLQYKIVFKIVHKLL